MRQSIMKSSDRITAHRLWMVIMRSHRALALLAEQSIAKVGLHRTDFAALEALLHKGPLTISEIQDKVLLASGSMTDAVDRLEKLGLVVRKTSPRDRRARVVEPTPEGKRLAHRVSKSMQGTLRRSCQHCPRRRRNNSTNR
jgi:MarR family 2-MHQ and catechol resistance regulon transcriptional repressor